MNYTVNIKVVSSNLDPNSGGFGLFGRFWTLNVGSEIGYLDRS